MEKKRLLLEWETDKKIRLNQIVKELSSKNDEPFTISGIIEGCIKDLLKTEISCKSEKKKKTKFDFFISEDVYYQLKSLSKKTGYSMRELINTAWKKYNPDVNEMWDLFK